MDILTLKLTDKALAREIAHWTIFVAYASVIAVKIVEMTVYTHYTTVFLVA